jgi:hypothetical protein
VFSLALNRGTISLGKVRGPTSGGRRTVLRGFRGVKPRNRLVVGYFPLDNLLIYVHTTGVMRNYSTAEVARAVGVDKKTLLRWLWAGKISEPRHHTNGGQDVRIWTERDLQRVRRFKEANYRKGRGRKKKT